ncbi:MAG: hypothetical protein ACRD4K_14345 [Candidatus Acidiferrales bacterium]
MQQKPLKNKKPGVKRRVHPSTHGERINSKLDGFLSGIRDQSHLVKKIKTKQAGTADNDPTEI